LGSIGSSGSEGYIESESLGSMAYEAAFENGDDDGIVRSARSALSHSKDSSTTVASSPDELAGYPLSHPLESTPQSHKALGCTQTSPGTGGLRIFSFYEIPAGMCTAGGVGNASDL
jgi:hypothetical protein